MSGSSLKILFGILCAVLALSFSSLSFCDEPQDDKDKPEAQSGDVPEEQPQITKDSPYKSLNFFIQALLFVRENYVDQDKVTFDNLMHAALKGMLQELDPFSSYETPERFKSMMEDTNGKFAGIGIVLTVKNNVLEIVNVMEDSPAFKSGLMAGDIVLEIDGKNISRVEFQQCIAMLKGKPGTKVTIKVYRRSDDTTRDFSVERAIIAVSSVKGTRIIDNSIGYVRITQFTATTARDLDAALAKFRENHVKGIIVDVRGNPGGLLTSAIEVCSRFLKKGEMVVSTEGRTAAQRVEYRSLESEKDVNIPLAVLINGSSASASEIFAGCMQDHKRAILVGSKSFGKGSVQTIVPMGQNNGAIRLTTAKYYTPSKKVIHGNGVEPDIIVALSPATENMLSQQIAFFPGEVKPEGAQRPVRDIQLERAIEILKGVSLFKEARKND